jgi:hypothetical protein
MAPFSNVTDPYMFFGFCQLEQLQNHPTNPDMNPDNAKIY